eukprot:TRINITY_DN6064_c0_g2_i1.p1 TRINITY_DN6064_c0_g2~~TRINITY_DN6064_c0_g2_i1.p1  ORF type:complete len:124 (-),score=5.01 TRINITY_DN6064_c0_g2_i1:680-1051(-)
MIQKKSQTSNIEDFERIDDSVQPILHLVPPPFISSCCYSVELAISNRNDTERMAREVWSLSNKLKSVIGFPILIALCHNKTKSVRKMSVHLIYTPYLGQNTTVHQKFVNIIPIKKFVNITETT